MSAELLRRAAQAERDEWAADVNSKPFRHAAAVHLAVADWLDWTAGVADEPRHAPGCDACAPAEAVARAVLGES